MKILKRSDYSNRKSSKEVGPQVRLNYKGVITINTPAVALLDLDDDDLVTIASNDDQDYFITKARTNDDDAFVVRPMNVAKTKTLVFNAAGIVNEMIAKRDLALGSGKKKSIKCDLSTDNVVFDKQDFYKIDLG